MYQIQNLTGDTKQKQALILPDQTLIELEIYFVPMQLGWLITELSYQGFVLNGLRITNQPNMLNQWRNRLPFGLACFSAQQREPSQQEDFLSGASKLYVLTEAEVDAYTEFLASG